MRFKFFILFIILPLSLFGLWVSYKSPEWKELVKEIAKEAQVAGFEKSAWEALEEKSNNLPSLYPLTIVPETISEVQKIITLGLSLQDEFKDINLANESIATEEIEDLFKKIDAITLRVKNIRKNIASVPDFLLSETEKNQKKLILLRVRSIEQILFQFETLERVFNDLKEKNEKIIILLQNQNEPRPTGGFVGSVLWVEFKKDTISWNFQDIYDLDRQIPPESKQNAPLFFRDLSPKLSLRDANLFPDFPTSAQKYRFFLQQAGIEPPNTILALNLNVVKTLLELTGPVTLDTWNLTLSPENFDMILSFLVEAKVSGRFGVKEPIVLFLKEIFEPKHWEDIDFKRLQAVDFDAFMKQKNILGFSKWPELQKLFEQWNITGSMDSYLGADNILYADFVSIGANKSEKFMWTKIWHNSRILNDGRVINTVEIDRNHLLRPGELDEVLGTKDWYVNLKDLLTEEIRWTLGEGQNRTYLRLYVPTDARILKQKNPSGKITEAFSEDKNFKILEIPMYVSSGEKIKINLTYETNLKRGSHNWRPYNLQVGVTPGKRQTNFLQTITSKGAFEAETKNVGKPVPMQESTFRAVVDFKK